jgi:delta14-sterol reductase/lamin-B receptor
LYDNFLPFTVGAILFSLILSVYLYVASFNHKNILLALGGNSLYPWYNFFIGRELNPRWNVPFAEGLVDLKYFNELRPGLFLWGLLNVAFLLKQYEKLNGNVTTSMYIVVFLQLFYIADAVFNEESILTTMDIIMDGFGFMLTLGDLAYVPFMYSLPARFLVDFPQYLSLPYTAFTLVVAFTGLYIFRAANSQKDLFKRNPNDPSVKDLPYIKTSTGTRLLAGGWWGMSRHMNYLGDWLIALAMSLPTFFITPVTYYYPFYFAILLWHRELRDEHKCSHKYGKSWAEYCKKVPYRIIPYVY